MIRITALASVLLLTTTACFTDVVDTDSVGDESTEAAVAGLSKKEAAIAFEQAVQCKPGDTTKDDCNTCVCHDGAWACTKKFCVDDDVDVAECKPGQVKKAGDGCNACKCADNGSWACTLKLCLDQFDDADEPVCKDGASVPAKDGCNTCKCTDNAWSCTKKGCSDLPTQTKPKPKK